LAGEIVEEYLLSVKINHTSPILRRVRSTPTTRNIHWGSNLKSRPACSSMDACRLGTLLRSSCNDPSERTLHLRYTQKNS
jgi:hypothetical protein